GFGAVLYALLQRARRPRAPGPGTGTQTGASASAASASVQGTQAGTAGLHDAPPGAGAAPHTQDPAAAQGPAAQDPAAQGPAAQGPFAQGPAAEDPAAQGHAQGPVPRAAAPLPPAFLVTLPRAGFWVRMGALLIDLIVVGVSLDLLLGWNDAWSGAGTRSQLVVLAIYGAVMWKTMQGRTIGNMAFDLHVVRQDGRELDWPIVIVRALGCILSAVVVFLGFFWIAIDEDHQAWHDKLAGTVVVRHSRRSAQPQQS
ncbi:MAG TPA: RDD family protein, partial [Steroidobacteraceae bacterium]|nr:RDD family protein [Steroidobacteraceae bacterium]